MNKSVLIANGPGLANLDEYRTEENPDLTLASLREDCLAASTEVGLHLDFRQTEDEDEMFRWVAQDSSQFDGVIINPVGYSRAATMTFDLYRAATQMIAHLDKPVIEVHLCNIFRRSAEVTRPLHEPEGSMGFICGFGSRGYLLAIRAVAWRLGATRAA